MTDRETFERWAETQPPYTTHDRAFAWAIWQDARDDLRAQHAALPEPALRLPARAGGYCNYFTEKQMREYRAGAQQAEPVTWLVRRLGKDIYEQAEPDEKAPNPVFWSDAFPVYAAPPRTLRDALDCRLCANFTTKTGGCVSVFKCVEGSRFKATAPLRYWMVGDT